MKISNQKLEEINKEYELFETYDKEIDVLNKLKEQKLIDIIGLLHQTKLLKFVKEIDEVKSVQLNIWKDVENPNWIELEIIITPKKSIVKFDNWCEWENYESPIRTKIYSILDENLYLSDFVMVEIEK